MLTASDSCTDGDTSGGPSSLSSVQAFCRKDPEPSPTAVPPAPAGNQDQPAASSGGSDGMEAYQRLQRRLLLATLVATALAVPSCWVLADLSAAASLLVGALAGLLYLVLLARSVAKLGPGSRSVSKVQLLVPVVLVLAAARIPSLQMLPALVGFLLYKPALIVQAVFDS